MTLHRLSRVQPGDMPTAADINRLYQEVERLNRMRATSPLFLDDTAAGPLLRFEGPIMAFVEVTGPKDAFTGYYPAVEQFYDPQTGTWRTGDSVWWYDPNE